MFLNILIVNVAKISHFNAYFLFFWAIFYKTDNKQIINSKSTMKTLIIYIKNLSVITLVFLFTLTSCGIYKPTDARKIPTNASERVKKNMEEGRGFRLGNLRKKSGGDFQFASSNPLWRAGLEKLNFAPLNNVDYAGGIIVTDWFSEGDTSEQIKITIRFLTNEIRSDAIDVIIHKKVCNNQNACKINKIESTLNSEIRFAILKKAAQIKKDDLTAKKKDNPEDYKLPKKFLKKI